MKNFLQLVFVLFAFLAFDSNAYAQLSWKKYDGKIPANVVMGGEENGQKLPVCRCEHNGGTHPGKVVKNMCHIGWGGKEVYLKTYDLLVHNSATQISWQKVSGNKLPTNAFKGGSENGKPMYVGQAIFSRGGRSAGTHPGKIFTSNGTLICNFGYGGTEVVAKSNFSVLTEIQPTNQNTTTGKTHKAWLWYNNTTSKAAYTLSNSYQYNSAGGAIQGERLNTGHYKITIPNFGKLYSGVCQASAYNGSHSAQVERWSTSGNDLQVFVRTFDANGAAVDGQFSAIFYKEERSNVNSAYTWVNGEGSQRHNYNYNGKKGSINVTKKGTGMYNVTFEGITPNTTGEKISGGFEGFKGNVLATPYGSQARRCKVINWQNSANGLSVNIATTDFNGQPADSKFVVSYTSDNTNQAAFVWANNAKSGTTYTPSTTYQMNNAGTADNTITRTGVGTYKVTLPGLKASSASNAIVTPYGSTNAYANIVRWVGNSSKGTDVTVKCFAPDGTPIDSQFSLLYTTNNPTKTNARPVGQSNPNTKTNIRNRRGRN